MACRDRPRAGPTPSDRQAERSVLGCRAVFVRMGEEPVKIDKNSKLGLFLGHVMPGVVRPLQVLWNQVIGFVFLVLAVWATPSLIRNIRAFQNQEASMGRVALSLGFLVVMLYFGITSFWRARKISRS
jgi:hypothetical protein